jgi:triosephosphate isomerase
VNKALGQAQHIKVGAQNMHWERSGPSPAKSARPCCVSCVRYVVLGHSERRTLFGETDEIVNRKVRAAHAAMLPIVAWAKPSSSASGATLKRSWGNSRESRELQGIAETVIAYEPVWAIGTGKTASAKQAQEAHAFIRRTLGNFR